MFQCPKRTLFVISQWLSEKNDTDSEQNRGQITDDRSCLFLVPRYCVKHHLHPRARACERLRARITKYADPHSMLDVGRSMLDVNHLSLFKSIFIRL